MPKVATKLAPAARGGFTARKVIPADVRDDYSKLFGKRTEERLNTGAMPILLARAKHREWSSEIEARIANIRAGRSGEGRSLICGNAATTGRGYVLMFPFYGTDIENMQAAQMVHGIVAVLFVAAMLAHIYIGTVGMEGAFEAMATGTVDLNWAREHHSLWLEEENARAGESRGQHQPAARLPSEPLGL